MTINIQKCSNVTVNGTHTHKNCKAVYCIDTGDMYASSIDAANAEGVTTASMSYVLTGKSKTCNGKRFCFVSKIMEHLDEINQANRVRSAKIKAYDIEMARQEAIKKAQETFALHQARVAELEAQLKEEAKLMENARLSIDLSWNNQSNVAG